MNFSAFSKNNAIEGSELSILKNAFDLLPYKIFVKDKESVYIWCNARYARDIRTTPEEIRGKTDFDLWPKGLAERYRAEDRRVIKEGATIEVEEPYVNHKNFWVLTTRTPLKNPAGAVTGILGMLEDVTGYIKLEEALLRTIDVLSAMVGLHDPHTSRNEHRVGDLAGALGAEMGLPWDEIKGLRIMGLLHDIGKVTCPPELLSKRGRLSEDEINLVRNHAQQGFEMLKSIDFPWPVAQTILQHHERLDGSGYPSGLKGEGIIKSARIIAVADTVEAMVSHRPYRSTLALEAALSEIEQQSGKLYDPQAVEACLRLFREKNYRLSE